MRISDWSSDVCSSDLDLAHVAIKVEPPRHAAHLAKREQLAREARRPPEIDEPHMIARAVERLDAKGRTRRSAGAIILRGQVDDDRLPRLRIVEAVDRPARDQPRRSAERSVGKEWVSTVQYRGE